MIQPDRPRSIDIRTRTKKSFLYIFLFFLSTYLLNAGGHQYSADGTLIVSTARSIIQGHGFRLDKEMGETTASLIPPLSLKNKDGEYYAKYSPLPAIVMLPATAIGEIMRSFAPSGSGKGFAHGFACSFTNSLITALTVAVLFSLCSTLGISNRIATFTSFCFGLSTIALPYAKTSFSEPLTGLLILSCFFFLTKFRLRGELLSLFVAALLASLIPLARLSAVICLIPLCLYATSKNKSFTSFLFISIGGALGLLVHGLFNFTRFGSFFETGYGAEAALFTTPVIVGIYGLLFSSDKSFFVYSPILLLAIPGFIAAFRKNMMPETACIAGILFLNIVFYSTWHSWQGGHSWGPRLLVPMVPICMVLVGIYISEARKRARLFLVLPLLIIGIAIQSAASLEKFFPHYVNASVAEDIQQAHDENRLFKPGIPRFLPCREQFSAVAQNISSVIFDFPEYTRLHSTNYNSLLDSELIERAPDLWFFYVWLSAGWKLRLLILAIVISLAAAACFSACRIFALIFSRDAYMDTSP